MTADFSILLNNEKDTGISNNNELIQKTTVSGVTLPSALYGNDSLTTLHLLHCLECSKKMMSHQVKGGEKTRAGKHRKRGKFIMCPMKSVYYCSSCPPNAKCFRAWCFPPHAGQNYFEKHLIEVNVGQILKHFLSFFNAYITFFCVDPNFSLY